MATDESEEFPRATSVKARVLLMLEEPCRVLTIRCEGHPHLPSFFYDQQVRPYAPKLCCEDLAETLDVLAKPSPFRVLAETIPPRDDDTLCTLWNPKGEYRLLLVVPTEFIDLEGIVDAHAERYPEKRAELTSVSDFRDVLLSREHGWQYRFTRAGMRALVIPCGRAYMPLSKKCAHTHTHKGIEFLESFVRDSGLTAKSCVQRHEWDSSAPLFKVDTNDGWYYVKLPTPGTSEPSVTQCLASLFPDDTLVIEAVSLPRSCFVSKEFGRNNALMECYDEFERISARKLARIQLESLQHLHTLKEAGLRDFSPAVLSRKIDELAANPRFGSLMRSEELTLEYVTSTMKRFCDELGKSCIPNTIVHGDFSLRNCGVRSDLRTDKGEIFYDWEGSCLSHPYCDLHNMLDEWWNESFQDEYFSKWSHYVNKKEAKRDAKMGRVGGAVVRICHLVDLADVSVASYKEFFLDAVESCLGTMVYLLQDTETVELLQEMDSEGGTPGIRDVCARASTRQLKL